MPSLLPQLASDHRQRLLGAMADAVRDDGLERATVASVVARARTSRRTFYEHFADRDECFLELFDLVGARLMAAISEAAEQSGDASQRVRAAVGAFVAALASDPALARACLRDTPTIGRRGDERIRAVDRRWAELIVAISAETAAEDPRVRPLPIEVAVVITGGLRNLTARVLDDGGDVRRLEEIGADVTARLLVAG